MTDGITTDAWGIDDSWFGIDGQQHRAPPATIDAIREAMGEPAGGSVLVLRAGERAELAGPCALRLEDGSELGTVHELPPDLPLGLHELVSEGDGDATTLLVGPGTCFLPDGLREWGVTVQVPTARSAQSWGIGDLADVRAIAGWVKGRGGDVVGLSPLHAPTPVEPIAASPYYPSSRRWRSPLLIRVDEVAPGDPDVGALASDARAWLAEPLVHRDECWRLQRAALEHVWQRLGDHRRDELERWRREQGSDLERWATFCALAERHGHSWREWPSSLRRPDLPAVAQAGRDLADRIAFHAWLQLLVAQQLDEVRSTGIRLFQDLAVGVDPGGADAWMWQDLLAPAFSVGAPPDEFQPDGQSWGLPPWIPWRLRDQGYRPLAALLRASMVGGGGLRVDHVMGLTRLFWVPEGGHAADGAYVRFAGTELLEVLALESTRAGAIVVGEDLGTVEDSLREELRWRRVLSTKVVWFEDAPPEAWPAQSVAMVTTHDLPTLAGMVSGTDAPTRMRDHLDRVAGPLDERPLDDVARDVHRRLGASPAALALATLEDVVGMETRPNRPGEEDPANWSLALPLTVDQLADDARAASVIDALAAGRGD